MEIEAIGTFDVKLAPIGAGDAQSTACRSRRRFTKISKERASGQVLAFRSDIGGAAGYVAMAHHCQSGWSRRLLYASAERAYEQGRAEASRVGSCYTFRRFCGVFA